MTSVFADDESDYQQGMIKYLDDNEIRIDAAFDASTSCYDSVKLLGRNALRHLEGMRDNCIKANDMQLEYNQKVLDLLVDAPEDFNYSNEPIYNSEAGKKRMTSAAKIMVMRDHSEYIEERIK